LEKSSNACLLEAEQAFIQIMNKAIFHIEMLTKQYGRIQTLTNKLLSAIRSYMFTLI
jgi:hypothetical protein